MEDMPGKDSHGGKLHAQNTEQWCQRAEITFQTVLQGQLWAMGV